VDGRFGIAFSGTLLTNRNKVTKLKNWGTNEAELIGLYQAFDRCINMVYEATDYPDLSNLDTGVQRFFQRVFYDCDKLGNVDLTNWQNLNNITRANSMFQAVSENASINLNNWDTSNFTRISLIFSSLGATGGSATVTAQNWDLTSLDATNATSIFEGAKCSSVDVSGWTFNPATNMYFTRMFKFCRNLTSVDLSTWVDCHVGYAFEMFRNMQEVQTINISGIDWSNNTNCAGMFNFCNNLTAITGLNEMSLNSVTNLNNMFNSCYVLQFTDDSNFDSSYTASNNNNLNRTFYNTGVNNPTPPRS